MKKPSVWISILAGVLIWTESLLTPVIREGYSQIEETGAGEGTFSPYVSDEGISPSGGGPEERISLDLRNIEVTEALRFLATKAELNVAVSKEVSGRLMLLLTDVPIMDVLDIILLSNRLAYDKKGDIYNIMTEAQYKELYGRNFADVRKVKIYKIEYAIPEQIFSMIDALKSEVGRVLVDQDSGTALVIDTEENLARIDDAVAMLEQKRLVRVFALQYAKAKDVEEQLRPQLDDKKAGSIFADERSNQVIIQTLPERMKAIARLIRSLDHQTKEVLIVSKIIKVSVSDDLSAEIKWEGLWQKFSAIGGSGNLAFAGSHPKNALARTGESFSDDFINITPTVRPAAGAKNVLLENLIVGTQQGINVGEVLLKFLKTLGNAKVLSSPRLTVVNNQEALIHVGEREAYVTTTTTTGTATSTTAEQVTFIDVGIKLSVTPTINDDGYITMKIKPEISSVTRSLRTPSGNLIPIVDTSEAQTTVMVKNGTSIIIAGLRRDDRTDTDKRIPFLGDIPLMGRLFRNVVSTNKRTELLVLLTPYIVRGDILETGEPGPPQEALKPYQDYSSLAVKPEKKPVWFGPVFGFFKKILFLGRD